MKNLESEVGPDLDHHLLQLLGSHVLNVIVVRADEIQRVDSLALVLLLLMLLTELDVRTRRADCAGEKCKR